MGAAASARRFDAIPLGINEIDDGLRKHIDVDLIVEKNLALVYPVPVFFFVAPQKAALQPVWKLAFSVSWPMAVSMPCSRSAGAKLYSPKT